MDEYVIAMLDYTELHAHHLLQRDKSIITIILNTTIFVVTVTIVS